MRAVLIASALALTLSLFGTPLYIRFLVRRGYGQFIRDDGPTTHHTKRGTPTMGGAVIIGATLAAYLLAHPFTSTRISVSAVLILGLMIVLGVVGWLDDFIKISRARSLGLRSWQKLVAQFVIATVFAILVLQFPDAQGVTPASTAISFVRDLPLDLRGLGLGPIVGVILFVAWINLLIAGTSNGVNLTDGLDGLATGATVAVAAAYILIGLWQFNQSCETNPLAGCYTTPHAHDLAILAAALMGSCVGFLWWNASPAKIFMGDTGSLALGGALAGLAITSRTELLLVILGGLFVIITMSVIIQVASFKLTGRRVFRMAPLQHHFELKGWNEVTIVIRFWIIAGLCVGLGMSLFYAESLVGGVL